MNEWYVCISCGMAEYFPETQDDAETNKSNREIYMSKYFELRSNGVVTVQNQNLNSIIISTKTIQLKISCM